MLVGNGIRGVRSPSCCLLLSTCASSQMASCRLVTIFAVALACECAQVMDGPATDAQVKNVDAAVAARTDVARISVADASG